LGVTRLKKRVRLSARTAQALTTGPVSAAILNTTSTQDKKSIAKNKASTQNT
jgi:hypothetical protein